MPDLGDAGYRVLNVVALKKMAAPSDLAAATGLPESDVAATVSELESQGLVASVAGSAMPMDGVTETLAASAAQRYAALRDDPGVADLATAFEPVNSALLTAMSAWQQVDVGGQKVANDHTDASYDDKIITRIGRCVQRLDPLITALSGFDGRFASYRDRFAAALDGIDSGRPELVSSPTQDSVHTIWFEFHEDLLRTLGRERTE